MRIVIDNVSTDKLFEVLKNFEKQSIIKAEVYIDTDNKHRRITNITVYGKKVVEQDCMGFVFDDGLLSDATINNILKNRSTEGFPKRRK